MGSQTLEILRQGIWASLTGGWFYDPHQNVSCNAIHLYLFLFLLCTPLVTYIYFTATVATWAFYCISVAFLVTVLKIINLALHGMYDKAQATSDLNRNNSIASPCKILQMKDEDVGIEMQVLGNDLSSRVSIENQSDDLSCANSAFSVDYPEQIASTIDFKVDVHRKNSSESNESIGLYNNNVLQSSVVVAHSADVCPTSSYGAEKVAPSKSFDEADTQPESEETKDLPEPRAFMQRQASLDSQDQRLDGSDIEHEVSPVKLQRHRSTENSKTARKNMSNMSLGCIHPNNCYVATHGGQLQNLASYLCLENDYTTKSELAIENISAADLSGKVYLMHHHPTTQMRRDSNSTMSAIQLPSASSSAALSRHPNAGAVKVLPSSVISVRRIKSAAIETSSPHPLAPYIPPQPNSVEVIGGQPLRNPHHVVLPPPSKSLSRNPHLNLCPKDGKTSEQLVYPIAEQADEVGHHMRPASAFDSSTSDSEEEEDNDEQDDKEQDTPEKQEEEGKNIQERHSTTTESESDIDRIQAQSTDSDTENNGSRSPLLEFHRISIENVEEKSSGMRHRKANASLKGDGKKSDDQGFSRGNVRFEQSSKENSKSSPFSDWEEASASSKDMLLTSARDKPKNPIWFDFSMDANNISVDVTTETEDARSPEISAAEEDRSAPASGTTTRNLGAIPKMGKRMESRRMSAGVDEYPLITHSRGVIRRPTAPVDASGGQTPILTFFNSRSDYHMMMYGQQLEYPMASLSNFRPRNLDGSFQHHSAQPKVKRSRERRQKSFDNSVAGRSGGNETNFSGNQREMGFDSGTICENPVISISNSLSMHDFMDSASIPHGFDKSLSRRASFQAALINIRRIEQDTFGDMSRFYLDNAKLKPMPKYYKFSVNFLGRHTYKIHMDRLQLLALFDRDTGWFQVILATFLTFLVSILGALVLHLGFYDDIFAFIFCFVIAGSQYSLIKSVQPDAASPIHGFNKTVSYSRPIYFCLCTLLLIGAHHMALEMPSEAPHVVLFGTTIHSREFYEITEYILSIVLLAFPILFSLGLFPQINTFLMYFLEQVEMHMFGGNAVSNLTAAFFAVLKSSLACVILYGPAYGGLIEPQGSQHVMFSIFCALLIPIAYHLSRTASDLTYVWLLIKSSIQLHSDEDEHERSIAEKVKKSSSTESNCSCQEAGAENRSPGRDDGSTTDNKTDVNSLDTHPPQPTAMTSSTGQPNVLTDTELVDPLPKKMQSTVNARLKHDLLVCCVLAVIYLGLHCSTVFTVLQPDLNPVLHTIAGVLGLVLHYLVPQMRKHWPWLCMSLPILRQHEFGQFEPRGAAKVMWFEKFIVYLCMLERNVLYPIVFLSALTSDSMRIVSKFGISLGAIFVVICGLKCVRSSFSDPGSQYLILIFSVLFFRLDYTASSETFLINYFFISILYKKTCDFLLKVQFIVTYIAPWQITWGSAFHAFAQPFSVPHSAMLFLQAGVSALLSTPLNPFLGSAIFLTSYVRPIKFWERDYNTRRIDHSNTRLSSQLERDLGSDDNNLNSIFYEHLTRSLQHSLCGDLLLGRWGNVSQGDCFVLASDYLNCLVHIIELGNGLCTFQMRGLEFRGTYCQQREVEAISEGVEENRDCCCCSPGHLPFILSVNAMFSTRWLAWQVVAAQYILEGYSISDNSAVATLQVFEFRRVLITYYVKSIIYYTIQSSKLDEWLNSQVIQEALQITTERQYVDLDPVFNHNLDEDYDFRSSGITRNSFCSVYMGWIQYCYKQKRKRETSSASIPSSAAQSQNLSDSKMSHKEPKENNKNSEEPSYIVTKDSALVSLCLALGILARRTLATASHSSSSGVEFFLHGLHALFKGDFRITSHRDEWVFADMDLLQSVVAPAVRMSLKLHQDHFQNPDDYEDKAALYKAISIHTQELVISHEADPLWRNAVLRGVPNLLALRHVMEDGSDEYRVIRLAKRYLSFRVIKLNRECVRGLWAGQQQELIYLRNRNPERGSIQNAKQALRNIINSSCDQPIGYPIYVSPLTTSYAETNEQLCSVAGGSVSVKKIKNLVFDLWSRVRQRCREGCSSGSAIDSDMGDIQGVYYNAQVPHSVTTIGGVGISSGQGGGTLAYGSQNLSVSGATTRGSLASMGKPTSSTLLAGILNRDRDMEREAVRSGAKRASSHSRISERERRATLPATSSSSSSTRDVCSKEILMGSTNSCLKHQESLEFCSAASSNSKSANLNTWKSNSRKKSLSVESRESRQKYGESSRSVEREDVPPANIPLNKKVIIVDAGEIYDCLNLGRRIDVLWPSEEMRQSGGRSSWRDWCPQEGMVGVVRHYWQPNHPDSKFRSNVNRTLLLIQIGEHYVPVGQNGVKEYNMIKGESDSSSINSVLVGDEGSKSVVS